MDFSVISGVTQVNGTSSANNKVKNANVQYGRNAMSSYQLYANEAGYGTSDQFPTQEKPKVTQKFNMKYMPEEKPSSENLNKMALLGASFADLGNKMSMSVETLTKKAKQAFGDKASAAAFDLNNDGQIDVAENATSILLKDMADKQNPDNSKSGIIILKGTDIDGSFTNEGEKNFSAFLNSDRAAENKKIITQLYQTFKLDEAKNIFSADPNNTAI